MTRKPQPPAPKEPKVLEQEVRGLLAQPLADADLRAKLEALASEAAFNGLTYLWGPELFRRNRVMFRPFILNHFATMFQIGWSWKPVRWKDHAPALDAWLDEVDRRDDTELFQRLYAWKNAQSQWGGLNPKKWRNDLLERCKAATERYQRTQILNKFDIRGANLDEATALALYEADLRQVMSQLDQQFTGWQYWAYKNWRDPTTESQETGGHRPLGPLPHPNDPLDGLPDRHQVPALLHL